MSDLFARPDSASQRALRTYQSLTHLVDRHANSPARRSRQAHPAMPAPHEVVRLVTGIAGGSIIPTQMNNALLHDALFSLASMAFVFVYTLVFTGECECESECESERVFRRGLPH